MDNKRTYVATFIVVFLVAFIYTLSTQDSQTEDFVAPTTVTTVNIRPKGVLTLSSRTADQAYAEAKAQYGWNPNSSVIYSDGYKFYLVLSAWDFDVPSGWSIVDTDCLPSTWTYRMCGG